MEFYPGITAFSEKESGTPLAFQRPPTKDDRALLGPLPRAQFNGSLGFGDIHAGSPITENPYFNLATKARWRRASRKFCGYLRAGVAPAELLTCLRGFVCPARSALPAVVRAPFPGRLFMGSLVRNKTPRKRGKANEHMTTTITKNTPAKTIQLRNLKAANWRNLSSAHYQQRM